MRSATLSLLLLTVTLGTGCLRWLPAPTPMRSMSWPAASSEPRCRLLLLPGAGDSAETFEEQAFVELIQARHPAVELVSANATMGYYYRGLLTERLQTDVVAPAERKARAPLWVLGISMGGMGALLHAHTQDGKVQGLILLAPYLGEKEVIEEIRNAGGLARWEPPPPAPLDGRNFSRQMWSWLKAHTSDGSTGPEILLGYGVDDRLAPAARLLAESLPLENVKTVPGEHTWSPWKVLLAHFIEHPAFVERCGGP
ncbi:MAG: alpha/beta fold hydrolase [Myxococcaceae bacterium]